MKKLFLLCVSALFAAGSYAQTSEEVVVMEVQDVQSVSKYPSVRGFVSNGFKSKKTRVSYITIANLFNIALALILSVNVLQHAPENVTQLV